MQFHLDYTPPQPGFELDHRQHIFLTGSCFAENVATKLKDHKFKIHSNPNGILFNPLSIHQCLNGLMRDEKADKKELIYRDGIFFSYRHHSSIHDEDDHDLLKKINTQNKIASQFLKEADHLIITFGSAFFYHHIGLNEAVANCHKQPASFFEKRMLTVEQITERYSLLLQELNLFNPKLRVIFTVSPVKYLKDGVVENNLSKSILFLSIHQLVKQFSNCYYFPAFELVNDDLRDYRFYEEDLAHPNEQAVDYIWEKFSGCLFSHATRELNKQIHALNLALGHRKLITNSEEAIKLNDFILKQKDLIRKSNPEIDFNH